MSEKVDIQKINQERVMSHLTMAINHLEISEQNIYDKEKLKKIVEIENELEHLVVEIGMSIEEEKE